jgi:acyl-CoA thioesterase-1
MQILKRGIFLSIFLLSASCETQNSSDDQIITNDIEEDSSKLNEIDINNSSVSKFSFLALGDSYTIGEGVEESKRWPNQFIDIAYEKGLYFEKPKIIAQTGWKTYDLLNAINETNFTKKYDYVSLLIGVNNQFNSRSIYEFEEDLDKIMDKIDIIRKNNGSTIIISIPDWGYTPFAESYNRDTISYEINLFNKSLKNFADKNDIKYVDVTEISRKTLNEDDLLASDSLHPNGLMYFEWAKKIYEKWID